MAKCEQLQTIPKDVMAKCEQIQTFPKYVMAKCEQMQTVPKSICTKFRNGSTCGFLGNRSNFYKNLRCPNFNIKRKLDDSVATGTRIRIG
jgi:hypothetical protein